MNGVNTKAEIILTITKLLQDSNLNWNISYIPSAEAYNIYISNEEDTDE